MRVEIAARCGNELGESVLWDSEREEVLWVDIERGGVCGRAAVRGVHDAA